MKTIALTTKNASKVATIINREYPEWGAKKFTFKGQPLNDGEFAHIVGVGSNGSVLFDSDFKFWTVASFK